MADADVKWLIGLYTQSEQNGGIGDFSFVERKGKMNQNVVEKINEKEKGDVEYFSEKVLVSVARRNK